MSCRFRWCLAICLCVTFSGCALWGGGGNWFTGGLGEQTEPEMNENKWASTAGKEARGNYPREEADWFERYIWSEKARDINRSLGFD